MNCFRLCQLAVDEANESLFIEPLRRLRSLLVDLPHHHNETGMYIQRERQALCPCFD